MESSDWIGNVLSLGNIAKGFSSVEFITCFPYRIS